jgi:hypothetical protein
MEKKPEKTATHQNASARVRRFLLWLCFAVAIGLLSWGIYLGDRYRSVILMIERDYLGIEKQSLPIEVDDKGVLITSSADPRTAGAKARSKTDAMQSVDGQRGTVATDKSASNKTTNDSSHPVSGLPTNPSDRLREENRHTVPSADSPPTDPDLQKLREVPVVKQIKVLVSDAYANSHSDWITQALQAVVSASRVFSTVFGIELRVTGVVKWIDASPSMDDDALFMNLKKHDREGADILLGFVDRNLSGIAYSKGAPSIIRSYHGAHGLVEISEGSEGLFLKSMLRSVGHLFGAEEITDKTNEAYRLGSWMSDAEQSPGQSPWIDPVNRKRILLHKSLPPWNPAVGAP